MKRNKKIVSLLASTAVIISMMMPGASVSAAESSLGQSGLSTVNISYVRPQDDFYEAVNGEWENTVADSINAFYGEKSTYSDIRENNTRIIREEFNKFISDKNRYGENSDERKMADVYSNYINVESRNDQGSNPVKKYISRIDAVSSIDQLNKLLGDNEIDIIDNIINFNIQENYNSTAYEVYIEPTSLSLIDSSRYNDINSSLYYSKVRSFYTDLLQKIGYDEAQINQMLDDLFKFESSISGSILSSDVDESQKDKTKCDILVRVEDLDRIAPNMNFSQIMKDLKIDNANYIIVSEMDWIRRLNELWTQENLSYIKNYIKINIIKSTGRYLSQDMDKLYYDFIESVLDIDFSYNSIEDEAYSKINSLFPTSLGKLYSDKSFNEDERKDVQHIADEVMKVYKNKISNCTWISNLTREKIMDKLNKMKINIGYSNSNQDYSNAEIKLYSQGGSLLENVMNLALAAKENQIKMLNKPISKGEITDQILPQDVVAEYHTFNNTVIITPGILQPELYNINDPMEKKLAGIGIVLGHEIGHSLDVLGAFFDGEGNIEEMWTQDDFNRYKEKVLYIRDYYSSIEGFPGKYIDGELTLCENIADIEAMSCILDLLHSKENADYKLFFESYARAYKCVKTQDGYEKALETDEHSPDKARVNIVLSQFQKFYDTYSIGPDDNMYVSPEYRIAPLW